MVVRGGAGGSRGEEVIGGCERESRGESVIGGCDHGRLRPWRPTK